MAEDNERRWMIEPDTARFDIRIGPEAKLSPELREALDHLAKVLSDQDEVQGYLMGNVKADCLKVTTSSCALLVQCSEVWIH